MRGAGGNAKRCRVPAPTFWSGQSRLRRVKTPRMTVVSLSPLVSLLAGVLILLMPRLLNLIVAVYLIVVGLIGLFHL